MTLIIPLIIFLIVNSLPGAQPPARIFADSVVKRVEDGKEYTDTVWKKIPDFQLVNQLGDTVSWADMSNKIVVANFFFTRCPVLCPLLGRNMKLLQETVKKNQKVGDKSADYVQFLSFSVDPDRDSVPELKKWADRFGVDPDNWWLLTGDKENIYDISINHMALHAQDPAGVDTAFVHTDIFVLLDRERVVRARRDKSGIRVYHGKDSADLRRLAEDIILLNLEKDKHKKGFLADKFQLITIVLLVAAVLVLVILYILRRKKEPQYASSVDTKE